MLVSSKVFSRYPTTRLSIFASSCQPVRRSCLFISLLRDCHLFLSKTPLFVTAFVTGDIGESNCVASFLVPLEHRQLLESFERIHSHPAIPTCGREDLLIVANSQSLLARMLGLQRLCIWPGFRVEWVSSNNCISARSVENP